jgi:hypothetical protein
MFQNFKKGVPLQQDSIISLLLNPAMFTLKKTIIIQRAGASA